jgi:type IX secretion system PorP/SprF family membrane protein
MINPAATGNSDKLIASLVARQQWLGIDNAPSTQFLNVHTYVDQIKGGAGLTILNDHVGFENTLNLKLNYAYHCRISETATLSGGLSAGFVNKRLDGSKLIYEQGSDPHAVVSSTSAFSPDFGLGVEFNTAKLTAGISSTHVNQSLSSATEFINPRHTYLYAKYKISAGTDYSVIPSFLVNSSGFIRQYELNTTVVYKEKIRLGLTYRFQESIVGLIGVNITDEILIGYSYDYNAAPIKTYSSGSHEIMIQARLKGFNTKKYDYKSPRFF